MIQTIHFRKVKLFEHLIRHNEFLNIILEGKILGKTIIGRPRSSNLKSIMSYFSCIKYKLQETKIDY